MASGKALRHVGLHLIAPLLMCVGMGLAYLSAFHNPSPRDLSVAIVGSAPETQVLAQRLDDTADGALDVHTVADEAAARDQLMNGDIAGAYLPDARTPRLLVNEGASDTTALAVEQVFTNVAMTTVDRPLAIESVTALSDEDPTNQGIFFLMVAVSIGSYGAAAAIGAAGAGLRMRTRALVGLAASFVVAGIGTLLAGPVFGVVDHNLFGVAGLAWLYSAGIVAIGIGLHTFLGRWTTLALMILFVALNFTSSGGIYQAPLLPGFFAVLHDFWIGAGFVEGARSLVYLGLHGFGPRMVALVAWLAAGLVLLGLAALAERRRARTAREVESAKRRAVARAAAHGPSATEEELEELVAA